MLLNRENCSSAVLLFAFTVTLPRIALAFKLLKTQTLGRTPTGDLAAAGSLLAVSAVRLPDLPTNNFHPDLHLRPGLSPPGREP